MRKLILNTIERIAAKEDGQFSIEDYTANFTDGSRSPETHYRVNFIYKKSQFDILIQTGLIESARIECTLSPLFRPVGFEVDSISPFANLFLRRKSRFKVKCQNESFKNFLVNKALTIFSEIMESKNFDPRIYTLEGKESNKIIFEFHLAFPDWINTFEQVNQFLKIIIDKLNTDYNSNYRTINKKY